MINKLEKETIVIFDKEIETIFPFVYLAKKKLDPIFFSDEDERKNKT